MVFVGPTVAVQHIAYCIPVATKFFSAIPVGIKHRFGRWLKFIANQDLGDLGCDVVSIVCDLAKTD
jgi:hypothetical protein